MCRHRLDERVAAWGVVLERVAETGTSLLGFGRRNHDAVVVKVVRHHGDEWKSGDVLAAFDGRGVVRVLDSGDGAVLLERLHPGGSLAEVTLAESDERATLILADVIRRLSPRAPVSRLPTVEEWGSAFARYQAGGDARIPGALLDEASRVYSRLCASQSAQRLLHGDLHHHNVLRDSERGWLAIDPKGVIGELEYEVGAALRNPYERPELFADTAVIGRRVDQFCRELDLDADRVLGWAFAQAVLAVVWAIEDGASVDPDHRWIRLANAIRPMLTCAMDL